MRDILDFLYQQAFTMPHFGTPVSIAELVGFVLGVATVWLVARNNIWTFPIGILQCIFFFILFKDAKLLADMWLQVFFIVIQIAGWVAWLKAGPNRTPLRVGTFGKQAPLMWAGLAATLGLFVYFMVPVLREAHGAYPVADSTSTGLSVLAQFLLTFKYIENWILWIVADLIFIPLYAAKDLYFTSALYIIFLLICVHGFMHWNKVRRGERDALTPNSSRAVDAAQLAESAGIAGKLA